MRVSNRTVFLTLALFFFLGLVLSQDDTSGGDNSDQSSGNEDTDDDTASDDDNKDDQNANGDTTDKGNDQQPDDTSDIKEIQIGDFLKVNKTITFNNSYQPAGYFFFTVKEKVDHRDLVILVRGREDFTHNPALFYSLTNKHPDLSFPDDISCGLTGHDFCVIPDEKVKKGQTYYLGIHCVQSCNFEVQVQYDPRFTQMLNNQVMYESIKESAYLLDLQITIPLDLDDKIEHILIESYILNFNQVTSNFHMYVNKGTTPPTPSSYDYITEELKLNGQSVLLERGIDKFAPGDIYSLAIEVPPKAKMLVRSQSFEKQRTIYFYKSVDDIVRRGQVRIFKLEISPFALFEWDKEELSIDLEPYFGNPDLYVNHGSLPEDPTNLASYRWSSTEQDGLESLTITKGSINNKSLVGEIFYIAVYGESTASFRLLGYSSSVDQRILDFNCVENGYSIQNEIINYQLPLEGESDTDITVKLTTVQGDTQLFIKRCMDVEKIDDCQVTLADINNSQYKEPEFRRSVEVSKNHKIEFKYSKEECSTSNGLNRCTHIIGVYGQAKGQNKYRLIGKHTIQPLQLKENEEHRSFLLESDKEYYKFTINQEDDTINRIEFSITSISGEIAVFSSRHNQFPNENDYEKAELASQDLISYIKNKKNPTLKGSYYISVQGISGAIYSIYVKVYRHKTDGAVLSNMKEINLGNVERGYLSYMVPHQYYFNIEPKDVTPDHQTNIVIYFNAYKNGTIPNLRVDPSVQITYQVNQTTFKNVTRFQEDYISSDFIYIKIYSNYTDGGKYILTLAHKDEVQKSAQIKYQLNVNAHNIIYIVPRGAYIQDLSSNELDNYELYVNEPAKVYLEVFECFGKVQIQAASSIEKIESKTFDVKSSAPARYIGEHTIVNYERDHKGPLYFSVQPKADSTSSSKTKSLYMIIPHILNKKQIIPHEIFSTPAEGQITTDISFDYDTNFKDYRSLTKIKFGPIECANGCIDSVYKPSSYAYFIHITNKDNYMQYFAKCNMDVSVLQNLGFNNTDVIYRKIYKNYKSENQPDTIQESFMDLVNGTYYIEVMGVVFLETNYTKNIQEPFTFIYPMKQFVVGDNNSNPNIIEKLEEKYILPLFIMVPLGIALLVLILIMTYRQIKTCIIRRRYRIAMEMQEKNPDVEVAEKDGNINDEDEKQKNKKKVDKINFLN